MSTYENALRQLEAAAEHLEGVPKEKLDGLREPQHVHRATLKVEMDDGQTREFEAYRVQHNNTLGPYKGGIRFHEQADLDEVKSLALWMSIKCAAMDIPLGGGKGGITVNPKELSLAELERLSRAFVGSMFEHIGPDRDIPAPDVNTNPQVMAWMADEYGKLAKEPAPGSFTGKPIEAGGSEGRGEATAQGGFYILQKVLEKVSLPPNPSVVIQGFGNAGSIFARLAHEARMKVVGLSDSKGAIYDPAGLDVVEIAKIKKENGSVIHAVSHEKANNAQILEKECDILVPAALENQITADNAQNIRAKIVLELANGPTTPEADKILRENGTVTVPDVLANAGGVTVSYFEWLQNLKGEHWSAQEVQERLRPIMEKAIEEAWDFSQAKNTDLRTAAFALAIRRILS